MPDPGFKVTSLEYLIGKLLTDKGMIQTSSLQRDNWKINDSL